MNPFPSRFFCTAFLLAGLFMLPFGTQAQESDENLTVQIEPEELILDVGDSASVQAARAGWERS